ETPLHLGTPPWTNTPCTRAATGPWTAPRWFLEVTRSPKYRALILLMYAAGLRISEALSLCVEGPRHMGDVQRSVATRRSMLARPRPTTDVVSTGPTPPRDHPHSPRPPRARTPTLLAPPSVLVESA
ncbi:MAG: hypothetical protein JW940_29655, partial [Polyangiaceae bacterium]|nr:hypothetical protein [Polyangiaceae bacterium]